MASDGFDLKDLIGIDFGFCLEPAIGPGGVKEPSFSSLPEAEAAWEWLERLRESPETSFLHLPYRQEEELRRIEAFADAAQGRYDDAVVVGIGGSSLGPQAVFDALRAETRCLGGPAVPGFPRLWFLDTVDPSATRAILDPLDLSRTLFLLVSKSGNTVETAAHIAVIRERLLRDLGKESLRGHVVAVTDPRNGPLAGLARSSGLPLFPVPPGVGGRFSVLSAVGLLPIALAGIDARSLLGGAAAADARSREADPPRNPALLLASLLFLLDRDRGARNAVFMPYRSSLRTVGDWFRQLVAESLGKKRADGTTAGISPAVAMGTVDQHSQVQLYMEGPRDKVVIFLRVEDHGSTLSVPADPGLAGFDWLAGRGYGELLNAAQSATAAALAGEGRPNLTISLPDLSPYTLGQLFWHLEVAVACLGKMLGIDPFDQPGVEEGKQNLAALMGRPGTEERRGRLQQLTARSRRRVQ
jgi:glucose-6-phosphate isomerase